MKKRIVIISIICILIIGVIGGILLLKNNNKEYLIEISRKELQEKIDNKDDFILVISREGCAHCAEYLPVFTEVLEEYKIKAYVIDIATLSKDDRIYLAGIANISGTPTTIFINDGEETSIMTRIEGAAKKDAIIKRLKMQKYIK